MTKTTNIIEFRPNRGRIETLLSVSDFRKQVQYFLRAFLEAQEPLQEICSLFERDENIWPDQYEYTLDLLESISEPVQELSRLLGSSTRLPENVISLRYPLMIAMHSMRELVNSLIHDVSQIRSMYRTSPKHMARQRRTIGDNLEALISKSKEAGNQVQVLFDEIDRAYFPKPGLVHR